MTVPCDRTRYAHHTRTRLFGWGGWFKINKSSKPGIHVLPHPPRARRGAAAPPGARAPGEIPFLCSPGPGTNSAPSRGDCAGRVDAPAPPLPSAPPGTRSPPASHPAGDVSPEPGTGGEGPPLAQVRWGGAQRFKCKTTCLIKSSPVRSASKDSNTLYFDPLAAFFFLKYRLF